MNDQPGSGNRWEPTEGSRPERGPDPTTEIPATPPAPVPPPYAGPAHEPAPVGGGRWRDRATAARAGLAAGAAAVLLLIGVGGFALGRAVTDDGAGNGAGNTTVDNRFTGGGPGQGVAPGGDGLRHGPGGGLAPGGRGDDQNDDGDDDGGGTPGSGDDS